MFPKRSLMFLTTALAAAALPAAATAAQLSGVDADNRLVSFSSASPKQVKATAIKGLADGERVLGLDRRPADGRLYLLGSTSRLYTVDAQSGQATAVGTGPFSPSLFGVGFGFDFNPVVDRIRVTSNYAQNLRLQPDTGVVAATDRALAFAAGDANAGTVPTIAGSAYTDNVAGTMTTQLLDIDTTNDVLALQDPPNDGGLKTVGELGAGDITNPVSFDISAAGEAFAALKIKRRTGTQLYRIDISTGKATRAAGGKIGRGKPLTLVALTVTG